MEILIILLILSLILNIFLIRRSIRIIGELEALQFVDTEYKEFVQNTIRGTLQRMREIDEKGAFESDDEVGAVFNELKATLNETTEQLLNEKKEEG